MAETQFPRGGGAGLDPYEHKKIRKVRGGVEEAEREECDARPVVQSVCVLIDIHVSMVLLPR